MFIIILFNCGNVKPDGQLCTYIFVLVIFGGVVAIETRNLKEGSVMYTCTCRSSVLIK